MQADLHQRATEPLAVLIIRYQTEDLGVEAVEPSLDFLSPPANVFSRCDDHVVGVLPRWSSRTCSYPPRRLKGPHLRQCADRARTRTVGAAQRKARTSG